MCRVLTIGLLLSTFFSLVAKASPTHSDWEKCNNIAVNILRSCLAADHIDCWSMSLQGYQDCRTMISQSYSTETKSKRVEAEKHALKQRIEKQ